jgi:CRISPR-associated protein Cas6
MTYVELVFPVQGHSLPKNHAYSLYSAISSALNNHIPQGIAIAAISGRDMGAGKTQLTPEARLRIRTPVELIGHLLSISGQFLRVGDSELGLGVPRIHALVPSQSLKARMVTIKGFTEADPFLNAARRQLTDAGITGEIWIPTVEVGPLAGKPCRRILKIKDKTIVGFTVVVENLSDEDACKLLASGIGGRRHMGCGFFVPWSKPEGLK